MKKYSKQIKYGLLMSFMLIGLSGCSSCSRSMKSFQSDISGGLDRHVIMRNQQGEVTFEYEGKIDIEDNDNRIKYIDDNDKWTIIYPGQSEVIITEK